MLTTEAADDAIRTASRLAGIPFYEVPHEFRQASVRQDLYFELDGHFNPAGHRSFAEVVAPLVHRALKRE